MAFLTCNHRGLLSGYGCDPSDYCSLAGNALQRKLLAVALNLHRALVLTGWGGLRLEYGRRAHPPAPGPPAAICPFLQNFLCRGICASDSTITVETSEKWAHAATDVLGLADADCARG
jgi:hypothetical protein